jgi:hypothetical protein
MPLSLYVAGDRWRAHLRAVAEAHPGIVPVAKGNGYGFGVGRLARRVQWLGTDTADTIDIMAVGTYEEAPEALRRFDGSVLVMTPWRPFLDAPHDPRLVHTVSRAADLAGLRSAATSAATGAAPGASTRAAGSARPRVVLEGLTSMCRHGMRPEELAGADVSGVTVEGLALHLPLAGDRVAEAERWLPVARAQGVEQLFVSHLGDAELRTLATAHPEVRLRPRIGTTLWLGDRGALSPRASVYDAHPLRRGDRLGYRQRRAPRSGSVLVVAGGTGHGVGLESPSSATSLRSRAVTAARGSLDAAGLALSPFHVDGRQRWFVEPPHMQVSMVFVPAGAALPSVGDEVSLDVRYTTTLFDRVVIT